MQTTSPCEIDLPTSTNGSASGEGAAPAGVPEEKLSSPEFPGERGSVRGDRPSGEGIRGCVPGSHAAGVSERRGGSLQDCAAGEPGDDQLPGF